MGIKKSKDFHLRSFVVDHLMTNEGVKRENIRHENTLDTYSSGGRVDLVVLSNHGIVGIELKSGSDSPNLLPKQCKAMRRAFDYAAVVADTSLDVKIAAKCGNVWPWAWYDHEGARFVDRYKGEWIPARAVIGLAKPGLWTRSSHANASDMSCLLWKEEVCAISGAAGGWTRTRTQALEWVRENMSLKQLRPGVMAALRHRPMNRWEEAFWQQYDEDDCRRLSAVKSNPTPPERISVPAP